MRTALRSAVAAIAISAAVATGTGTAFAAPPSPIGVVAPVAGSADSGSAVLNGLASNSSAAAESGQWWILLFPLVAVPACIIAALFLPGQECT